MEFSFKETVIQQLEHMASEPYQKKEWSDNTQATWFVPDEILCMWFDDAGARTMENWKGLFSDAQINEIKKVSDALDRFKTSYESEKESIGTDLLHYAPWVEVRTTAQQALERIKS